MFDGLKHRHFAKAAKPIEAVILIRSSTFFLPRDKDMKPKSEEVLSSATLNSLLQAHPDKTIVVCLDEKHQWMKKTLTKHVRVFEPNPASVQITSTSLRTLLVSLGIRFRPIRNIRTISLASIHHFAMEGLKSVGPDDYAELGVQPDKDATFQDVVKRRQREALWV